MFIILSQNPQVESTLGNSPRASCDHHVSKNLGNKSKVFLVRKISTSILEFSISFICWGDKQIQSARLFNNNWMLTNVVSGEGEFCVEGKN